MKRINLTALVMLIWGVVATISSMITRWAIDNGYIVLITPKAPTTIGVIFSIMFCCSIAIAIMRINHIWQKYDKNGNKNF